ncbi:SLEI family protein (macronuclear) [Tetrahymena thermophila SB210]|uniref:SLEI family protein n=1 Tax=Tetrahymena thermophila (strain SB210) TaxID=312017 RepID=W7XE27_TETTS|nr:SLEI family protein [Tetrahymena thermophila SB210]EWS75902.1 SLEI family protein [Tetrahymena thermophila SB210]|eukprot:XP_012651573.1 SLEI family protein [Tetrahymena thermophila SB210]
MCLNALKLIIIWIWVGFTKTRICLMKLQEATKKQLNQTQSIIMLTFNQVTLIQDKTMFDLALETYKKILEVNPEKQVAYNNIGLVYFDQNMNDEALEQFNKALQINPNMNNHFRTLNLLTKEKIKQTKLLIVTIKFLKSTLLNLDPFQEKGLYKKRLQILNEQIKPNANLKRERFYNMRKNSLHTLPIYQRNY